MMNNLSTLPIDLGQTAELKGDNSFSPTENEGRGESFSQLLSQNSLENTGGNKAAKVSAAETTEREKGENLPIENSGENGEEGDLTANAEEESVLAYQERNQETKEQNDKDNQASDVLASNQESILAIGKETTAVLGQNDKAEQTAQFLQLLQNSDKALIENKEAVATQEQISTAAQNIKGDEKDSGHENIFQQAKQVKMKGEQPIDTNTGKNWRAGIELPIDPLEKLQQIVPNQQADANEQKQISKAEQALAEQSSIKSLSQDNVIAAKTTATNAMLDTEITDKRLASVDEVNNKVPEKKLTSLAQEIINQANNTVTQQTDTTKTSHNASIPPLTAGQQNLLAQEKKLTKEFAEALVASEQTDENNVDTVEKSVLEQLSNQTKKQPEQHKVEQQIYSSIVNQSSATKVSQYSESELKEIQSLQATAEKVAEHNTQNQKIEMLKQAETIAIYKKDFINNLQDKVMVMVQQKLQQVDIRLDPPELGKMQVKLHLHNDQASVQFVVQNQQAKEALDQSMPRLREMLAEQGINLGNTNVGQQGGNDFMNANHQESSQQVENITEEEYIDASQVFMGKVVKGSATGIDYYA